MMQAYIYVASEIWINLRDTYYNYLTIGQNMGYVCKKGDTENYMNKVLEYLGPSEM